MATYKITLEYDGSAFAGWQRQAAEAGPTVQGVLEEALGRLCDHPVTVHGSGRTDSGVHARGQVASFETSSRRSPAAVIRGGNCLLPPQLAILKAEEAPPGFHARFSAKGKTYEYDFLLSPTRRPLRAGRAWWVGPDLNWGEIAAALPHLLGRMDFAAFQSVGSEVDNSVREISRAEFSRPGRELARLSFSGSGFLRHQVRTMAGTLVEIGRGRLTAASLPDIIASRDRGRAGPTAPAHGLCLVRVDYDL